MAVSVKPLNDTQVKQAKVKDKAYKLSDGAGLYLYVTTLGAKSWRMDYVRPISKKRATMTLGLYPELSLAKARQHRTDIRAQLASGIDPQQQKIDDEQAKVLLSNNTFAAIADDYMSRKKHVSHATTTNNKQQ